MKKVIVLPDQSLYDICLQVYGSLEYVPQLLVDNSLELSEALAVGQELYYDDSLTNIVNTIVKKDYAQHKIRVISSKYFPPEHQSENLRITVNYENEQAVSITYDASGVEGDNYSWSFEHGDFSGNVVTVLVSEQNCVSSFSLTIDGRLMDFRV